MSCGQQGMTWLHFSLSVSIKDRSLHMALGKSQIYCPEHILVYGRREDLVALLLGIRVFLDRLMGGGMVEVLAPH